MSYHFKIEIIYFGTMVSMNGLFSTLTISLCIRYLRKNLKSHKLSCIVIKDICVFSRFIMVLLNDHRCYILLMLMFSKNNVLCHIRRTGGCCAIFVECTAYYCDLLLLGY